ncbi:MAG: porin family protein [Thiothrix sp.]|nr:porin family protein [Thiothrix sp.]HPE59643.1 porin family protein [Thiolinea sp.]
MLQRNNKNPEESQNNEYKTIPLPMACSASIFVLSLFCSHAALAEGAHSYNYIDGEFSFYDEEGPDYGLSMKFSRDLTPSANVLLGIENYDDDISLTILRGGLGVHTPIAPTTDLYGEIGLQWMYASTDIHYGPFRQSVSEEDIGYNLGLGIRHKLTPEFELNAKAEYRAFDEGNVEGAIYSVGGRAYLNENWSAGASYRNDDELDSYGISLRHDIL